jgi:hypothetical protein
MSMLRRGCNGVSFSALRGRSVQRPLASAGVVASAPTTGAAVPGTDEQLARAVSAPEIVIAS